MDVDLNKKELRYIKNCLLSSRMYRGMELPHGVVLWKDEWMNPFLDKITNALDTIHNPSAGTQP